MSEEVSIFIREKIKDYILLTCDGYEFDNEQHKKIVNLFWKFELLFEDMKENKTLSNQKINKIRLMLKPYHYKFDLSKPQYRNNNVLKLFLLEELCDDFLRSTRFNKYKGCGDYETNKKRL